MYAERPERLASGEEDAASSCRLCDIGHNCSI
jgi:hypothetical protein